MVPAAEVLARECPDIDFVDCNIGCPIDLGASLSSAACLHSKFTRSFLASTVFNQGAGSALMGNPGKLGKILTGMSRALGTVPMTVKMVRSSHSHPCLPHL